MDSKEYASIKKDPAMFQTGFNFYCFPNARLVPSM